MLLLVDDDAQIRQLLSEVVTREGFEVLEAADGAAALEMLQRRHMDLVLLDLRMPRVNGLEVLRVVRASGSSSHVALMSGAAAVEDAVEAIKLGASEYFSKPLDMPRVRALMQATVLITGETGTGKELVAKALHELGPRKLRKLVTGATADKAGVFEAAKSLAARRLGISPRSLYRLIDKYGPFEVMPG